MTPARVLTRLRAVSRSALFLSSTIAFSIVFGVYAILLYTKEDGGAEAEKKIYFADNISPAYQKVIDRFNEKYKGKIRVESIDLPFSKFSTNERKELFARYLRSKSDQIDIFSVDQINVTRFAKWCEPLDRSFSPAEKQDILQYALRSCSVDDSLVAIPLFIDVGMMYYRRDYIRRLPNADAIEAQLQRSITWKEFISLGRQLRALRVPFYIYQADQYEGLLCSFCEMLENQRQPLFAHDSLQLESAEALNALTLLTDLVHTYKLSPALVTQFKEMNSYRFYVEHNAAFLRGWPNFVRDYQAVFGDLHIAQQLAKAPLPHFEGHPPASILGGWNLIISKYSVQKKEALIFIKYLVSEEAQKIMYEEGGYLPVNNRLYADTAYVRRHPDLLFYKQLMTTGVDRPRLIEYTKISDIISECLKAAINGDVPPKVALANASRRIHAEGILHQ
jgi:multiple sugar transport system substrate-binding protein